MKNYPVGDFLIQIKNAALARRKEVETSTSGFINDVAGALKRAGFLDEVEEKKANLIVRLTYHKKEPLMLGLKLVSRPGLRIYMGVDDIEKLRGPFVLLVSTPEGVLTSREAVAKRVGGEVIAKVW
jgi:small subunit ribosomal protein S8